MFAEDISSICYRLSSSLEANDDDDLLTLNLFHKNIIIFS